MKNMMKSYIFQAILLMVLGIIGLARPNGTLEFLCRVYGVVLAIMGTVMLIIYVMKSEERKLHSLIIGFIELAAGIALLVDPPFFSKFMPYVGAVMIAYGAVISLLRAFKLRKYKFTLIKIALCLSVIVLLLAVIVLLQPAPVKDFISLLTGIALVLSGLTMLLANIDKDPAAAVKR